MPVFSYSCGHRRQQLTYRRDDSSNFIRTPVRMKIHLRISAHPVKGCNHSPTSIRIDEYPRSFKKVFHAFSRFPHTDDARCGIWIHTVFRFDINACRRKYIGLPCQFSNQHSRKGSFVHHHRFFPAHDHDRSEWRLGQGRRDQPTRYISGRSRQMVRLLLSSYA